MTEDIQAYEVCLDTLNKAADELVTELGAKWPIKPTYQLKSDIGSLCRDLRMEDYGDLLEYLREAVDDTSIWGGTKIVELAWRRIGRKLDADTLLG